MRSRSLFLALFAALSPGLLQAACTAQGTADRTHMVELYTAEGCSSCPPADTWLSTLRDSAKYIGLEYHVDYWDAQGWHDPYGDARYTERQRVLVKRNAHGIVFTPQIVLDGQIWKDWPKPNPPAPAKGEPVALSLDVAVGEKIHAKVAGSSAASMPPSYQLYVALSENGLTSAVKAGENHGRKLNHDMVVRDLAGPLSLPQAEADLKLPASFNPAKSAVVAFVEDSRNGDIVQALRLPLDQCKP